LVEQYVTERRLTPSYNFSTSRSSLGTLPWPLSTLMLVWRGTCYFLGGIFVWCPFSKEERH
jgi:hypothetical protein